MDVSKTEAWKEAQWDYSELQANMRMPALVGRMTYQEIDSGLRQILRKCPQYYPAKIEMGLRMLVHKGGPEAERIFEEGFRLLLDLAGAKTREQDIDVVLDGLEETWRFDLSRRLMEILAEQGPLKANRHDCLGYAAARLGDYEAAERHINAALQLKPRDKNFWSNKGLLLLMNGKLKDAGLALSKARKLAPEDPIILGNIKAHEYLAEHGGNYFDYLVRPFNREEMDELADHEEWEKFDELRSEFNFCRMEAFAQSMFMMGGKFRSRLASLMRTLDSFFDFVAQVDSGGNFMHEEIGLVSTNFKAIMHKFIFKFGDVDRETMDNVFEGLKAYYGFLAEKQVVAAADFKVLEKAIRRHEGDLIAKMERYNKIRHDPAVSEKKKDKIRSELFEGDHEWPHI